MKENLVDLGLHEKYIKTVKLKVNEKVK